MSQSPLYVAFQASERLRERIDAFLDAVDDYPGQNHVAALEGIMDPFLDELLHAYFTGPIDAAGARGPAVAVMLGAMKIINKASRSLASRLMRDTSAEEQRALADHFRNLRLESNDRVYVGHRLEPALAQQAVTVFQGFADGQGNMQELVTVMHGISQGVIDNYLDKTVANLRLGRIKRGLVAGARVTIRKASAASVEKGIPAMEPQHRQPVVAYYKGLLLAPPPLA